MSEHEPAGGLTTGVTKVDKTMSPTRANVFAGVLALFVGAGFFVPYALVWGSKPLLAVFERAWFSFLLVLILSVVVHELLHGLGFVLAGRVSWREVELGLKGGMAYAHCKVPLRASAYRVSLVLPGVVLGLVPGLVGLVGGSAWLTVYGALMFVAALGDALILWLIRAVPGEARVQDHPSMPGCQVLWANERMGE
jgi:hypothetical protein